MSDDDKTVRGEIEAAMAESTGTEQPAAKFDTEAAMQRVLSSVQALSDAQASLAPLFAAYPRVQTAFESGELQSIVMRGLAKISAFGGSNSAGWLKYMNGDPFNDVLMLDNEIREQGIRGDVNEQEQRHIARDRQLAAAERLVGALAELKAKVSTLH